jgi:penicillin-binding protein 2
MSRRRPAKNPYAEAEQFRRRAALGFVVVATLLAGLAGWYFKLQVVEHRAYVAKSEENRVRPRPVVPARGNIFDRNGVLLAENVPAYRLEVLPEKAGDTRKLFAELGKVIALDPDDIKHYEAEAKATGGFRPVPLKLRLGDDEIARFAIDRWRFPGVEVAPYLTRRYPFGDLFAHVIGYVGRIDEKDLATLPPEDAALSHIGKTGLERYYEEALRGKVGYEKIETNVEGRAVRSLGRVPAVPGTDLRLGIDVNLQRAMVAAFGDLEGSAIAMDPRSGEILAMVSIPSFDPNLFVNGISHADYAALNDNPSRPQFNRLVLGGVAPGSTVKPLTALAGLESGVRKPGDKVLSTGMFRLPGMRGRGWADADKGGNGWTDMRKAIYESVNTYFYMLALDLGVKRYDEYLSKYGYGQKTGVDLLGEIEGILPSPAAKARFSKEPWYPGDLVNSAIGQGLWKVTPLQLVREVAAIANGGELVRPHLVAQQRTGFDAPWRPLPQPAPVRITGNMDHLKVIQEAMQMTTTIGTAAAVFRGSPYPSAGKTGTAQVVNRQERTVDPKSLPLWKRHRALYVGYAPADNPAIAVAVEIEGGGFGASTAAPIARRIMDAYLLGKLPDGMEKIEAAGAPKPGPGASAAPAANASVAPEATQPVAVPPAAKPATEMHR